jgi:putative peptidoglycan lipid II flippase
LMTREALMAYSVGLLGLILVKVLAPGFYARQNVRTPVKIALLTLTTTQILNLAFVMWLDLRHAGLALAISVGACLNAALLYYMLRRNGIFRPQLGWTIFLLKIALALALMAVALWTLMGAQTWWLERGTHLRVMRLGILVIAGATTYLGTLWLTGFRLRDFAKRAS